MTTHTFTRIEEPAMKIAVGIGIVAVVLASLVALAAYVMIAFLALD